VKASFEWTLRPNMSYTAAKGQVRQVQQQSLRPFNTPVSRGLKCHSAKRRVYAVYATTDGDNIILDGYLCMDSEPRIPAAPGELTVVEYNERLARNGAGERHLKRLDLKYTVNG